MDRKGFGMTLKPIRVYIGDSNNYRIHHIVQVCIIYLSIYHPYIIYLSSLSIYPYISLSIYNVYIYLSIIYPSIYLSIYLSTIHISSIYLPTIHCPSIHNQSIYLSIYLPSMQSIYLCVDSSIHPLIFRVLRKMALLGKLV